MLSSGHLQVQWWLIWGPACIQDRHLHGASRCKKPTMLWIYTHYDDVIMGVIASLITSLPIVYSTVYSDADQRKHQSSASLAFVWGIHRGPVNPPHKWPVTRKMFPFDDVIMGTSNTTETKLTLKCLIPYGAEFSLFQANLVNTWAADASTLGVAKPSRGVEFTK